MGLAIFLPVRTLKLIVELPVMCQTLFHPCPHFIFAVCLFRFFKRGSIVPILQSQAKSHCQDHMASK